MHSLLCMTLFSETLVIHSEVSLKTLNKNVPICQFCGLLSSKERSPATPFSLPSMPVTSSLADHFLHATSLSLPSSCPRHQIIWHHSSCLRNHCVVAKHCGTLPVSFSCHLVPKANATHINIEDDKIVQCKRMFLRCGLDLYEHLDNLPLQFFCGL